MSVKSLEGFDVKVRVRADGMAEWSVVKVVRDINQKSADEKPVAGVDVTVDNAFMTAARVASRMGRES
jgi:hypothetical protein